MKKTFFKVGSLPADLKRRAIWKISLTKQNRETRGFRQHDLPVAKTSLFYSREWLSLFAPLTTSLRPKNSLSCNSSTARFASSTDCI